MNRLIRRVYCFVLLHLPKKISHMIFYRRATNKKLDLNHPADFNEKIQYLIVNKYGKKEGDLADKYKVKEYVKSLSIDNLHVPKTIKIYENANDINLDELPSQFVLKCNHGSGNVFICTNKEEFDLMFAKKELNKQLRQKFSKNNLEYHYNYIKPLIIVEEYLKDNHGRNPVDYKFYIFNGKCDRILVCSERDKELKLTDFDTNWNVLDDVIEKYRTNVLIEKPNNLDMMISIAEQLCKNDNKVVLPFCRVDLYNIDNNIYFGEYTFTPAAGIIYYYKQNVLDELGKKIDLDLYN